MLGSSWITLFFSSLHLLSDNVGGFAFTPFVLASGHATCKGKLEKDVSGLSSSL